MMPEFLFTWGFVCTRLWRYLAVYFLKPMDAVNDTVTAVLVRRMGLEPGFLELGAGDGVYSFILGGGRLPLSFDRYLSVVLDRDDIYDNSTYERPHWMSKLTQASLAPVAQIDAKIAHCMRMRDLNPACISILANLESLPLRTASVRQVFFYTPHGVRDHSLALAEAARILEHDGSLVLLRFDMAVLKQFASHNMSKSTTGAMHRYFDRLSGGRRAEIAPMAATRSDWESKFSELGLVVEFEDSGLSFAAWQLYDIQTRPVLKPLIRAFNSLSGGFRLAAKLMWMTAAYPIVLCVFVVTNRLSYGGDKICYRVWRLRPAQQFVDSREQGIDCGD